MQTISGVSEITPELETLLMYPKDYEPNKKEEIKIIQKTIPNIIDPDIYAPLPKRIKFNI